MTEQSEARDPASGSWRVSASTRSCSTKRAGRARSAAPAEAASTALTAARRGAQGSAREAAAITLLGLPGTTNPGMLQCPLVRSQARSIAGG